MQIDDDSYDLFRRAVVERDTEAWMMIAERYRSLLVTWAARCRATLLGYLRACVTATAIDAARAQMAYERLGRPAVQDSVATPEQIALERIGQAELWRLIHGLVNSETERIVVVERFVLDLPPRAIQARHPDLFADVRAVYAAIRNLCERLRRNPELRQYYAEHRTA